MKRKIGINERKGRARDEELAETIAGIEAAHQAVASSHPVPPAACEHDWKIWPETNGQSQRCMKCGAYRDTPDTRPDRKRENG